jgi:SAM-dependent methyltransferase
MSEEHRAASMPKVAASVDEPLIGGEEGGGHAATAALPDDSDPTGDTLALAGSVPPPAEVPTTPSRRPRMALRIPDDEVARPESKPPPPVEAPAPPPPPASLAPLVPARIISINPPAPPPELQEPEEEAEPIEAVSLAEPPVRSSAPPLPPLPVPPLPRAPPSSAEPDEDGWSGEDDRPTPVPAIARKVAPLPPEPPTEPAPLDPPAVEEGEPDGEDIRFEEDTPTPALPAVMADAPEVSPEDLVAVESMPARTSVRPVPPPKKAPPKPPLVIVPPNLGSLVAQPVDSPGSKRKGRLWWEDFFNDDYVRTMEKITDAQILREVAFVEESLGVERGGAILDLACGTGRHAVELATRGYEVVGFDLSLAMLSRAGDEAQDRGVKLNFLQGDMREMSFEEQFDGIFCWNTSFGYFEEEKNAQVVQKVHRALKTGGMFLLDVINRDFLVRQSPSLCWFEGDGCVCMDDMQVDFITSRMKVKRTMMLDDGRTREVEYSIRTYGLHELGKILHDSGFKVCEVSGRLATPGVFFGNESPRTIILAEKR